MRRPIKAHLVNRSNRPVYRSKPVTHAILNLDLNSNRSNRPVNRSNRSVYRYEPVELSFLIQIWIWPVKPVRFTGTVVLRFGVTGWGKKPCVQYAPVFRLICIFVQICAWYFYKHLKCVNLSITAFRIMMTWWFHDCLSSVYMLH